MEANVVTGNHSSHFMRYDPKIRYDALEDDPTVYGNCSLVTSRGEDCLKFLVALDHVCTGAASS